MKEKQNQLRSSKNTRHNLRERKKERKKEGKKERKRHNLRDSKHVEAFRKQTWKQNIRTSAVDMSIVTCSISSPPQRSFPPDQRNTHAHTSIGNTHILEVVESMSIHIFGFDDDEKYHAQTTKRNRKRHALIITKSVFAKNAQHDITALNKQRISTQCPDNTRQGRGGVCGISR